MEGSYMLPYIVVTRFYNTLPELDPVQNDRVDGCCVCKSIRVSSAALCTSHYHLSTHKARTTNSLYLQLKWSPSPSFPSSPN